jgi:hypothetical protein
MLSVRFPGVVYSFGLVQFPEKLFAVIDDFAHDLYAVVLPDKTQYSAAGFLEQVINGCPYVIEVWYTGHGREWEGNPETHAFMKLCYTESVINASLDK